MKCNKVHPVFSKRRHCPKAGECTSRHPRIQCRELKNQGICQKGGKCWFRHPIELPHKYFFKDENEKPETAQDQPRPPTWIERTPSTTILPILLIQNPQYLQHPKDPIRVPTMTATMTPTFRQMMSNPLQAMEISTQEEVCKEKPKAKKEEEVNEG